jgi:hypothetical protein
MSPCENTDIMSIPHLHLILTHAPIFAVLFGVAVLVAALLRRSPELRWTAYALFVAGALVTIPVFLSGEGSEEALEHVAGVSKTVIEAHADAAKVSLIAIEALGVLSLVAFVMERMRPQFIAAAAAVLVIAGSLTAASLGYTANLGGQIRHSEIRTTALSANEGSDRGEAGEKKAQSNVGAGSNARRPADKD